MVGAGHLRDLMQSQPPINALDLFLICYAAKSTFFRYEITGAERGLIYYDREDYALLPK